MSIVSNKVAILTDSVACLPGDFIDRYGIHLSPINLHINGKIYRDGIDLNAEEAYQLLEQDPEKFASAPASIGEYISAFESAAQPGGILCITISSKLSTMYNVAKLAKEQAPEILSRVPIEVVDSGTATIGEGLIVTAAARSSEEGKNLTEVSSIARNVSARVKVFGILDTIRYVYRTGRIPKLPARVGSMLNIKPVFAISGGVVHITTITNSREKGVEKVLKDMENAVKNRPVHVAIAHASAPESGEGLKQAIETRFNCVESWLTHFSPVMAYATGTGVLAVAYYTEN